MLRIAKVYPAPLRDFVIPKVVLWLALVRGMHLAVFASHHLSPEGGQSSLRGRLRRPHLFGRLNPSGVQHHFCSESSVVVRNANASVRITGVTEYQVQKWCWTPLGLSLPNRCASSAWGGKIQQARCIPPHLSASCVSIARSTSNRERAFTNMRPKSVKQQEHKAMTRKGVGGILLKMSPEDMLDNHFRLTPLQKSALKKLHVATVRDLLYHFPARYEAAGSSGEAARLVPGTKVALIGALTKLKAK